MRVCGLRVSETKGAVFKSPFPVPPAASLNQRPVEPVAILAPRGVKKKSHGFLLLVSGSHVTTHTHTHSPHFASSTTTLGGLCHLLNASQVWECVCVCDGEGAPSLCAVLAVRATLRCRQPGKSDYSSRYLVSVLNVPKCDGTCSLPTPGRSLITVADRSACRRIREQWREYWGKMVNRCYSDRLVISHSSKA